MKDDSTFYYAHLKNEGTELGKKMFTSITNQIKCISMRVTFHCEYFCVWGMLVGCYLYWVWLQTHFFLNAHRISLHPTTNNWWSVTSGIFRCQIRPPLLSFFSNILLYFGEPFTINFVCCFFFLLLFSVLYQLVLLWTDQIMAKPMLKC